jgi:hypothetical protein
MTARNLAVCDARDGQVAKLCEAFTISDASASVHPGLSLSDGASE